MKTMIEGLNALDPKTQRKTQLHLHFLAMISLKEMRMVSLSE